MTPPPEPPGPENPIAVAALIVLGCALLPIGWLVFNDAGMCADAVVAPPNLVPGGVCGAVSAALIALPLWLVAGAPRSEAVDLDGSQVVWRRPRIAPRLLPLWVAATPVMAGMLMSAVTVNTVGVECGSSSFASTLHGTCLSAGLSPALVERCREELVWSGGSGLVLALTLVGLLVATRRTRCDVRTLELDDRGLCLDGQRFAWVDLDALRSAGDALEVVPFEGPVRTVRFRRWERAYGEWFAAEARARLPRGAVHDDPAARSELLALRTRPGEEPP